MVPEQDCFAVIDDWAAPEEKFVIEKERMEDGDEFQVVKGNKNAKKQSKKGKKKAFQQNL